MSKKSNQDVWRILEFTDDISEELAMQAVRASGKNIKYISNPSKEVIDAAIKHTPTSIMFVDNPDKKQIVNACRMAPRLFTKYADLLSDDEIIEIAATCRSTWVMVGSPAFNRVAPLKARVIAQIRHEVIGSDDLVKQYCKNPRDELAEKMLSRHPQTIHIIDKPTDEMYVMALSKSPKLISQMKNPPVIAIETACLKSPSLVTDYGSILGPDVLKQIIQKVITNKSIHCAKKICNTKTITDKLPDVINKMLLGFIDSYENSNNSFRDMSHAAIEKKILEESSKIEPKDIQFLSDDLLTMLLMTRPDLSVHVDDLNARFPWFIDFAPHYVAKATNDIETLVKAALLCRGQPVSIVVETAYQGQCENIAMKMVNRAIWSMISDNKKIKYDVVGDIFSHAKSQYDLHNIHQILKTVLKDNHMRIDNRSYYTNSQRKINEIFIEQSLPIA